MGGWEALDGAGHTIRGENLAELQAMVAQGTLRPEDALYDRAGKKWMTVRDCLAPAAAAAAAVAGIQPVAPAPAGSAPGRHKFDAVLKWMTIVTAVAVLGFFAWTLVFPKKRPAVAPPAAETASNPRPAADQRERFSGGHRETTPRDRPAPVKVGEIVTVEITATGSRGDGIAKVEGMVIFVPGATEGETVRVEITEVGPRSAKGRRLP